MTTTHATAITPRFTASAQLASHLQAVLVDLIDLQLQGKQAHWNIVGTNFRSLHLHFDEIASVTRTFSDTVAERMRALQATPDGRVATLAATTLLPPFPAGEQQSSAAVDLIAERIEATVQRLRQMHDAVDAEDAVTADILDSIIEVLEKHAWLLAAENIHAE